MKSAKPLLAWDDYLRTGIDIVDQQHRGLIDLANETAAKLTSGEGLSVDEERSLLGFLTDYSATHFATEEALMALGGVDEAHVLHHRQSHTRFLQEVNAMVAELGSRQGVTGKELMDFLGNWLIYHILGEDQQLSQLLHHEPVAAAVPPPGRDGELPLVPPAQVAANRSLAKLYAFMAERNRQLQASAQAQRKHSKQMKDLVAEQTAELSASEERFRILFHNGALPIIITHLESNLMPGLIVDANPAVCRLLGYEAQEMLKLSPLDLVAPEEVARFPLLISELLVTGRFECELGLVTKAGRTLTARVSMAQFVIHGEPVAISIIQDVSAPRATQLAQDDIRQQTRHLAEIRGGFLAGVRLQSGVPRAADAWGAADADDGAKPERIAAILAGQPLFRGISQKDKNNLAAASRVRRLRKGDILFDKGDRPAGLLLVVSGQVLLAVSSPQGGKKVLGILAAGQSIGEAEVVTETAYPYAAESVDDAEVLEIGQAALLALLEKDKGFARNLIACMGSRLHDLVYSVESYTLRSGAERVIAYLLQHAEIDADGQLIVELPATKQLIASLLSITPETLSRIFRDLGEAGLIHTRARHIQIPDVDRLVAYRV